MTCQCDKKHSEKFTCSGAGCNVCLLGEKQVFVNNQFPEEKLCILCATMKAVNEQGVTESDILPFLLK